MHQYSKFDLEPYVNRYVWVETTEGNRLQAYVQAVDDQFVELVIMEIIRLTMGGREIDHRITDHLTNRGNRTTDHRIIHPITDRHTTGHRITDHLMVRLITGRRIINNHLLRRFFCRLQP
ncbi:hypothetical protein [Halolactibacillus sp. JCM 19043]|uniref:hypothetical protein n=1 Tax=Halolactibacillus sp. JCM 19043 TaxID=1460638 RepID=UPI0012E266BA|nr:hypothetical protein [Halolactibacillus sp. JCM 19043]